MRPSTKHCKKPTAKHSNSLPRKSVTDSASASSPKADFSECPGFHGSPGTNAYHVDRSCFPPADSSEVSSTPTTPSISKSLRKEPTPLDPLSCLAAPCPTPRSISGEQVADSRPGPSSPPKSSAAHERPLSASAARRLLENKLQTTIPRSSFYRWLNNGVLPAHKLVSKYLILPETLNRFADEAKW